MSDSQATIPMGSRLVAEAIGTFVLVLGGVGTAVFAAGFPGGSHQPRKCWISRRGTGVWSDGCCRRLRIGADFWWAFQPGSDARAGSGRQVLWKDTGGYVVVQIVGGAIASSLIFVIAKGHPDGYDGTLGANGYGAGSPGGYNLLSVGLIEAVLTGVFVLVIVGVTSKRATAALAPLAIGLTLTLIHLVAIPVSNTSVNPARSIASAIYGGEQALTQLWAFLVFPVLGALVIGALIRPLFADTDQ